MKCEICGNKYREDIYDGCPFCESNNLASSSGLGHFPSGEKRDYSLSRANKIVAMVYDQFYTRNVNYITSPNQNSEGQRILPKILKRRKKVKK